MGANEHEKRGTGCGTAIPDGLQEVEDEASALVDDPTRPVDAYQAAQRQLWTGLRAQGCSTDAPLLVR